MRVTVRDDLKRVTPCEHGGRIIEASETMPSALDYSANFNPYLHPRVKSAIKASDAGSLSISRTHIQKVSRGGWRISQGVL